MGYQCTTDTNVCIKYTLYYLLDTNDMKKLSGFEYAKFFFEEYITKGEGKDLDLVLFDKIAEEVTDVFEDGFLRLPSAIDHIKKELSKGRGINDILDHFNEDTKRNKFKMEPELIMAIKSYYGNKDIQNIFNRNNNDIYKIIKKIDEKVNTLYQGTLDLFSQQYNIDEMRKKSPSINKDPNYSKFIKMISDLPEKEDETTERRWIEKKDKEILTDIFFYIINKKLDKFKFITLDKKITHSSNKKDVFDKFNKLLEVINLEILCKD